jgi:hypothetical protein
LATLTIDCGASLLELPVRPPRPEDNALPPFGPAEEAQDTPAIFHPVESSYPRRITRDLLSGRMVVDFPRWTQRKELTDIGQTHSAEGMARYVVVDGDPLSARCETFYHVEIARPDATITHESRGALSCSATEFRVEMEVVLKEAGREVFRRAWDERIPRDMV